MSASTKNKKGGRKLKQQRASEAAHRRGAQGIDSSLFTRFAPYVESLYDPENASGALFPSEHAHMGASRRKPFNITYTSAVDNETVIFKMYPRLNKTIVKSVDGTVPVPSALNQVFIDFEGNLAANSVSGLAGRPVVASGGQGSPDFELPMAAAVLGGQNSLAVACSVPAASNLFTMFVNRGDFGIRVNPYYRDAGTGVWTAMTTFAVPAGASIQVGTTVIANGISGFGFNLHNTSDSARFIRLSAAVNTVNTSTSSTVVLTYPASTSSEISALADSQNLDQYRTTAMSMRLTCMGDLTTTAGQVACALVPREFVPDPNDIVGSIAQLPTGAFDGKLLEGCDIIWQPRQVEDYDYQAPEFDKGSHYLIVAANLAHANTPIRLKASYNYEIFSLDPTLGMMQFCPSAFGLQEVLQAVFSAVPPGSSNDKHSGKFKGALAALKAVVSKGVKWVQDHPAEVAAAAKAAAALLLV